jgi:hypothetical protein
VAEAHRFEFHRRRLSPRDFRVGGDADREDTGRGTSLHASVDGHYLSATPWQTVVRWRLIEPVTQHAPAAISESAAWKSHLRYWRERGQQETRVAGETVALDANGTLSLDLPATFDADFPYRYTFQGEVEDLSRQRLADSAGIEVYPASVFVGLHLPNYFADVAKGATVDVAVVDHSGAPVPRATVTLTLNRVNWNSVRRAEGSGFYTWDTERVVTPAGQWTYERRDADAADSAHRGRLLRDTAVTRDAAGRDADGRVVLRPRQGLHRVGALRPQPHHAEASMIAGSRARRRVMIQSPWESATALLTSSVKASGTERFALTSTQQTVEIPITEGTSPTLLSVLLIRGRMSQDIGTEETIQESPPASEHRTGD